MPKTPAKAAPTSRTYEAFAPRAKRSGSRPAPPPKRASTRSGRTTIAILAGLAIGLVAALVFGLAKPSGNWAFDRPEAKLPSLQSKHTLY